MDAVSHDEDSGLLLVSTGRKTLPSDRIITLKLLQYFAKRWVCAERVRIRGGALESFSTLLLDSLFDKEERKQKINKDLLARWYVTNISIDYIQ